MNFGNTSAIAKPSRAKETQTDDDVKGLRTEIDEARNLLIERHNAEKRLPELASSASNQGLLPSDQEGDAATHTALLTGSLTLTKTVLQVLQPLQNSPHETALENVNIWLADLYDRWTTLSDESGDIDEPFDDLEVSEVASNISARGKILQHSKIGCTADEA